MSTNAYVSYQIDDSTLLTTYVHWDGYTNKNTPGCVGRVLLESYNDPVNALKVASAGYISSLKADLEESVAASANKELPQVLTGIDGGYEARGGQEWCYVWMDNAWYVWSDGVCRGTIEDVLKEKEAA